jgi:hypothetical protein
MSLTIGLTTLFGSAVGAGIGYVGGILTHLGSSSRSLSPKATAFAGAIILGGAGWAAGDYYEGQQPVSGNITQQQAIEIAQCHSKAPEGFDVESSVNKDGSVSCSYLKPN